MTQVLMGSPHYAKHDLQFYDHGCGGKFTLEQLVVLCVQRLRTLGLILRIAARNKEKTEAECRELLKRYLKKENVELFADLSDDVDDNQRRNAREMDNVSHNLLRLLLVQDDETAAWFLKTEKLLFRWRIAALDEQAISNFRAINDMTYPVLDAADKKRLKDWIAPLMEEDRFETTKFYEVPVFEVPDLLKKRLVHVVRGIAYINELEFRSLISYQFQRRLARILELGIGAKYYVNDTRMEFLGERLRKVYESLRRISFETEEISIADLDELSKISYPPCMRILHEALESRCHLRNGGRVQYTLFLKSAGLKADDAIAYFHEIFTRRMSPEYFIKEYAYQFRHMYGLVGSGKDYGNRECVCIAEETQLGPNDCHGCFFANHDIEDLGKVLERWQIPTNHVREIARFAEAKEYGKACGAYFEALHETAIPTPIVRPQDFFRQSRQIRKTRDIDCFLDDDETE